MYAKRMSELREFCFLGVSGETGLPAPNSRYGLCGRETNVRRRSSFHLILFCMEGLVQPRVCHVLQRSACMMTCTWRVHYECQRDGMI